MSLRYKKIHWTEHSKLKMKQYGLSKNKIINLLYKPERKEQGIVAGTKAIMATNKFYSKVPIAKQSLIHDNKIIGIKLKKFPGEIWVMYKDVKDLRKIISAWRYPGVSKPGEVIPVPEDIRQEVLNM